MSPRSKRIKHSSTAQTGEWAIGGPQTERSQTGLTGDVYELTVEDARMIAMSNQILGKIFLTDPYDMSTPSFITITISTELTNQFTVRRPRVM
jgi:hypothetical protein